jgi:hypothetical protein
LNLKESARRLGETEFRCVIILRVSLNAVTVTKKRVMDWECSAHFITDGNRYQSKIGKTTKLK